VPNVINRTSNFIGKSNWSNALYAGRLDEFSFYDRALTGEQVRSPLSSLTLARWTSI